MNTEVAYTWGTTAAERSLPFPCDREKVSVSHPGGSLASRLRQRLLPWGDLVMMRRQLLNLKALAEA